jgi:hypothetical protein
LDFIYFLNEQDEDAPYEIGQIVDFAQNNSNNTLQLQIRRLKHYDDFAAKHGLNSFTQANSKKDEVCNNNLNYYYFTYNALLAPSLLHTTNRNYSC